MSTSALFKALNPQVLLEFLSMGVGVSLATFPLTHGAELMNSIEKAFTIAEPMLKLPHHVLIATTGNGVHILRTSRHERAGAEIYMLPRGTFGAHFDRGLFQVELYLHSKGLGSEALLGKWGPLHHDPIKTARAVVALSDHSQ